MTYRSWDLQRGDYKIEAVFFSKGLVLFQKYFIEHSINSSVLYKNNSDLLPKRPTSITKRIVGMENGDQNFAKSLDKDDKLMVKMLIVIHLDYEVSGLIFLFSLFLFSSNFLTGT